MRTPDQGSPHAPEIPTPTPAVNLSFNIEGLAKGLERTGGFFVGEGEEKPQQLSMKASMKTRVCFLTERFSPVGMMRLMLLCITLSTD